LILTALELLDGDAMPIPVKLDILALTKTPKGIDYEADTEIYNKAGKRASLPQFATMMADDSTLLSGVSELDVIPQSQTLTEQRLKFWFQQADPDTRARFYNGRSNNLRRNPHFFPFSCSVSASRHRVAS
jgi:uncharacterized protein YccT (UPF0319 family)